MNSGKPTITPSPSRRAPPVPALREPLARGEEQRRGQHRRHHRPPEPHERGIEGTDDALVAAEAGRAGAVVSPRRRWFPAEPTGPFLRLSYVGASPEGLARGVSILKGVLDGPGDGDARRPG